MTARPPAAPAGALPGQQQQHPQFSLPGPTPEQVFVQMQQGGEIQRDVRSLASMGIAAFTNLQDAMARLLPFHLFNAIDPSAADLDETPDHEGANLTASRHEAWQDLCVGKANDMRRKAQAQIDITATLEAKIIQEALSGSNGLDRFAMARLQEQELQLRCKADKDALAKLLGHSTAATGAGMPGAAAAAVAGAAAGRGAGIMLGQQGMAGKAPGSTAGRVGRPPGGGRAAAAAAAAAVAGGGHVGLVAGNVGLAQQLALQQTIQTMQRLQHLQQVLFQQHQQGQLGPEGQQQLTAITNNLAVYRLALAQAPPQQQQQHQHLVAQLHQHQLQQQIMQQQQQQQQLLQQQLQQSVQKK